MIRMLQTKIFMVYGLLAFGISLIMSQVMMKANIMDVPGNRSSHKIPTPRSGGIGIIVAFVMVLLGAYIYGTLEGIPSKPLLVIFASSLFMGFVGFLDDIRGLTWLTRFLVQLILATTIVLSGVTVKSLSLPYFGIIDMDIGGSILAVLWIMGLTNAFNFMDGINGISGGVALIVCIIFLRIVHGNFLVLFALGLLPFAILGFLIFNFPKGKIFLGDSGSQFLGFFFASLGLILPLQEPAISLWIMPMAFFIYLFETAVTIVRRSLKKKTIFAAHRDHFYQLLVRSGWTHGAVAFLYFSFFALQGYSVTLMMEASPHSHVYFFMPMVVLYTLYGISVVKYAKHRGVTL